MLPLESVSWDVAVTGPVAEVTVHQRFSNASSGFVDASYVFPLPDDAVVDRLVLRVGNRVIRSAIAPRDEARATYEAAAAAGKVASLLSETEGSLFVQEVANLAPWTSIDVELSIVLPAQRVAGEWQVVLPLVAPPRFETAGLFHPEAGLGVAVDVSATIQAGAPLVALGSPTHPLDVSLADGRARAWNLAPDRDLVLRWSTGEESASSMLHAPEHVLLSVWPPELAFADRAPREVVWVVDTPYAADAERVIADAQAGAWPDDRFRRAPTLEAALASPADPRRHRTIAYLGTGSWPDPAAVLGAVARARGVTVSALGLGPAPDRARLAELARLGGGAVAFDADSWAEVLTPARLSDVAVDWADCPADRVSPERIPDVRDEPVRVLAHVGHCFGPVWVSATSNGRRIEWPVWPEAVAEPRALAVAWARARVSDLERRVWRGDRTDVTSEIREIGLRWSVVTRETSLVAVDTGVVNLTGRRTAVTQTLSTRQVMGREFLQRIPAGRSYQQAVQIASGVAGTFSLNFDFDAIAGATRDPTAGPTPDPWLAFSPADPVTPQLGARSPSGAIEPRDDAGPTFRAATNNLGLSLAAGAGPYGAATEASVRGPVIRDKAWATAAVSADRRTLRGITADLAAGFAGLTLQPVEAHRFELATGWDTGRADAARWGGGLLHARWQIFTSPEDQLDTRLLWMERQLGDDPRARWQAGTRAVLGDRADHDLTFGAGGAGWRALGLEQVAATAFAEDRWDLDRLQMYGGARATWVAGRTFVSPRLHTSWDPWGDDKTRIAAGFGRATDADRVAWAGAPVIRDTVEASVEREIARDAVVALEAGFAWEALPLAPSPDLAPGAAPPFAVVERRVASLSASFRKVYARRWSADLDWTWSRPFDPADPAALLDPSAPWIPGFLDPYRAHRVRGGAGWELPSDPWTTVIGFSGTWSSAIAAEGPWWLGPTSAWSVRLAQAIPVRRGELRLSVGVDRVYADPTRTVLPLEVLALVPGAPDPGEEPPFRAAGAVEWTF